MRRTAWLLVLCGATLVAAKSLATSFSSFGPQGAGGSKNGQVFQVGDGGTVFELDAFLAVNGFDLNGGSAGTSAQLSGQSLPTGLALGFSAALSDPADAVLTYVFTNLSSGSFTNLRFSVLLDAEVDQEFNTFFNEFGTVIGTLGNGAGDVTPDMWQIDEPGFVSGTCSIIYFWARSTTPIPFRPVRRMTSRSAWVFFLGIWPRANLRP